MAALELGEDSYHRLRGRTGDAAEPLALGLCLGLGEPLLVPWPQTLAGVYLAPSMPFLKMIPSL